MIKSQLFKLLEERNIEIDDLVEELGVTRGTIRHLLDGSARSIEFDVLEGLCDFLKCEVGDLLKHE